VYERGGEDIYSFYAFYGAVGLGLVILTHWSLHWLNGTFMGLHMRAIHDDRLGAMASGINTVLIERTAFTVSAAVAGIAGASFAFYSSSIVPSDFDFNNGLLIILYVVLGARSISRCTLAAVGVYVFYEAAKLRMFGILGEGVGEQIAQSKEILLALLLIFTAFLPPTNRLLSLMRKV
jgi:ABC-type branched-subunit amino acid transport system permease subunit